MEAPFGTKARNRTLCRSFCGRSQDVYFQLLLFQRFDGSALFHSQVPSLLAFRHFCAILRAVRSDCSPLVNVVFSTSFYHRANHYGFLLSVQLDFTINLLNKLVSKE